MVGVLEERDGPHVFFFSEAYLDGFAGVVCLVNDGVLRFSSLFFIVFALAVWFTPSFLCTKEGRKGSSKDKASRFWNG